MGVQLNGGQPVRAGPDFDFQLAAAVRLPFADRNVADVSHPLVPQLKDMLAHRQVLDLKLSLRIRLRHVRRVSKDDETAHLRVDIATNEDRDSLFFRVTQLN